MGKPTSWVYFIQEGTDGPIKIGYTAANPKGRLAALQTGNAKPLRVVTWAPGTTQDERDLHERFKHLRMQGEWFQPAADLVAFVHGVAWSSRDMELPDEEGDDALECGLTRSDLQDIGDFVEATRLYREAWKLARNPLATVAAVKQLLFELESCFVNGGNGVDIFGRDGFMDRRDELRGLQAMLEATATNPEAN